MAKKRGTNRVDTMTLTNALCFDFSDDRRGGNFGKGKMATGMDERKPGKEGPRNGVDDDPRCFD